MPRAVSKFVRAVGLVLILIGFALTARWYIAWLDQYLPWSEISSYGPRKLALFVIAILTSPTILLAIIVEWLWHSWPMEVTSGFFCWLFAYALLIVGSRPHAGSAGGFGPEHE